MSLTRRCFLGSTALYALGCRDAAAPRARRVDPLAELPEQGLVPELLRIGVTPSSGAHTADFFLPLVSYLGKRGIRAEVVTAGDYDNLAELVGSDQLHAGVFAPLAYVKARIGLPAVPVATASQSGSPTYLGYLMARPLAGGAAPTVESLRDKRIAWVSRSSASGYLYPRAMLQARGLDPNTFFAAPPTFAGDHESAIRALIDGKVDAAATASSFVDPGAKSQVVGVDQLSVVAKTSRIPFDCVVLHKKLARAYAISVRKALLELVEDGAASQALAQSWGISGFLEADDRRYDEIDKVLASAQP